jgi:hypothetical protein
VNEDAGSSPEEKALGKLDGKSTAGLAYMLDYVRSWIHVIASFCARVPVSGGAIHLC